MREGRRVNESLRNGGSGEGGEGVNSRRYAD